MKLIKELELDPHQAQELIHMGFFVKLVRMGAVKDHYQIFVKA